MEKSVWEPFRGSFVFDVSEPNNRDPWDVREASEGNDNWLGFVDVYKQPRYEIPRGQYFWLFAECGAAEGIDYGADISNIQFLDLPLTANFQKFNPVFLNNTAQWEDLNIHTNHPTFQNFSLWTMQQFIKEHGYADNEDDVLDMNMEFNAIITNDFGFPVRTLYTDNYKFTIIDDLGIYSQELYPKTVFSRNVGIVELAWDSLHWDTEIIAHREIDFLGRWRSMSTWRDFGDLYDIIFSDTKIDAICYHSERHGIKLIILEDYGTQFDEVVFIRPPAHFTEVTYDETMAFAQYFMEVNRYE